MASLRTYLGSTLGTAAFLLFSSPQDATKQNKTRLATRRIKSHGAAENTLTMTKAK